MDIIQLLPDSVANQIAAGEVIQRPASVIKELVENAIDAGATNINVLVTDAGKTAIQVIDNGVGMSDTDARLSFERHATSKIRQAVDLFSLHTMGFRGEALASIAAVAQVTLHTRRAEDEIGTRLVIAGSQTLEQEPSACPVGSNFLIENLFYNIPARRKFLKSNATEMSNINQAFERIVLVYPNVNFSLSSNGMEVKRLLSGTPHQRITDIFGKKMNRDLLSVNVETSICTISGFVGKPESAKKKGAQQFFFVNGRYMKHPYFHKAVMTAYDRLLPDGSQVSYFIYLTVDPQDIDVNIHPVKTEIKFENEREIWQILMAAVRNAVGRFTDVDTLDFDTEGKPDIPVFNAGDTGDVDQPVIDFNPSYNPFAAGNTSFTPSSEGEAVATAEGSPFIDPPSPFTSGEDDPQLPPQFLQGGNAGGTVTDLFAQPIHTATGTMTMAPRTKAPTKNTANKAKGWEELWAVPTESASPKGDNQEAVDLFWDDSATAVPATPTDEAATTAPTTDTSSTIVIDGEGGVGEASTFLQVQGCYILTTTASGLVVIDQNRASQRVLFEQYMRSLSQREATSQKLLFPELVQFPPSYLDTLPTVIDELTVLGFELTDLGGGSYSLGGTPPGLEGLQAVSVVNDLVAAAVEIDANAVETLHATIAEQLARKAAIPYGELLSQEQMQTLYSGLMQCSSQRYTPDGKAILTTMSLVDLQKRLK